MGDPISAGNLDWGGGEPISAGNLDRGDRISAGKLDGGLSHICRNPTWGGGGGESSVFRKPRWGGVYHICRKPRSGIPYLQET